MKPLRFGGTQLQTGVDAVMKIDENEVNKSLTVP